MTKAARLLLDKGALPDEFPAGTPPDKRPQPLDAAGLRGLAWSAVGLVFSRVTGVAFSSPEASAAGESIVRGAAKIASRDRDLAAAMYTRLAYLGPVWIPMVVRAAMDRLPTEGALLQGAFAAAISGGFTKVNKLAEVE